MEQRDGTAAVRLVGRTLDQQGFRSRARYLAAQERSADVADAFLERAVQDLRRDPLAAAQCARLARRVAAALRDQSRELAAWKTLGQAYAIASRFPSALRAYDAALAAQPNEALRATIDLLRIYPLVHLECYDEARSAGERALRAAEDAADRRRRVQAHMALADLAFRVDRPRDALRHYAQVDALLTPKTSRRLRGALAANRANALEARNRFRAAARHFELAKQVFGAEGCEHTLAQVEYNAAYMDALRGEYTAALRGYARTEETFRRLGDERHLALNAVERAEIHVHLNMPEEAGALAVRAEEIFERLGMGKERAQAAQLAGQAAELAGDLAAAEAHLGRAAERFADLGLAQRRTACLVQRSLLALKGQRPAEARALAEEAAALLNGDVDPLATSSVALLRARIDMDAGQFTDALHRVDTVRMDCRRIHAPWLHIEAHRLTGRCHAARGDLEEAIVAYKRAIDALEKYRGGVPPDEYMAAFLAGRSELYAEIVDLLVRAGYSEMAFVFTERAKSRALVDLLAGRARGKRPAAAASMTERRLLHLRESLNAIYRRLFRHDSDREKRSARAVMEARREASELEQEIARLLRRERLKDPAGASLETIDGPGLDDVRRELNADTALVEFFVTSDRLFTFVVTREHFHVVARDVGAAELRRLIERFRFHLSKFERDTKASPELVLEATRANLARLTEHLLEPLREWLTAKRLVIVPHGVLHKLPFHALPWGEGWLADRHEVVYAPSAAVYGYCRKDERPAKGPACVFGLPDELAPEIGQEVRRVAETLGTDRLHMGDEATVDRLRAQAADARILHIATHGMFRKEQPMLSSIRLADTWLNLYDIYGLDLGAELVVLSTCESGTADVTTGDEILGLTRGFLYAGARALLASQWRVHDEATAEFMALFYERLEAGGDAATALHETMAAIRARRPHPYYWAPFFLTGRPTRDTKAAAVPAAVGHTQQDPQLEGAQS